MSDNKENSGTNNPQSVESKPQENPMTIAVTEKIPTRIKQFARDDENDKKKSDE